MCARTHAHTCVYFALNKLAWEKIHNKILMAETQKIIFLIFSYHVSYIGALV